MKRYLPPASPGSATSATDLHNKSNLVAPVAPVAPEPVEELIDGDPFADLKNASYALRRTTTSCLNYPTS